MSAETERKDLFWCKLSTGEIHESWKTAYDGHQGHVHCVRVSEGSPLPEED